MQHKKKYCLLIFLQFVFVAMDDSNEIEPRIIGGQPASIKEAPYQASIRTIIDGVSVHFCGGSIITNKTILTAAHCLEKKSVFGYGFGRASSYKIIVGTSYRNELEAETQIFDVERILPHCAYNKKPMIRNDIALMYISGVIRATDSVKIIEPAKEDVDANTNCLLTGWGQIDRRGSKPRILQKAVIKIFSHERCKKMYRQLRKTHLCAGIIRLDAEPCFGDSGGPLKCNDKLAGVVSIGSCGEQPVPAVFTKVSAFNNFIQFEECNSVQSVHIAYSKHIILTYSIIFIIFVSC